MSLKLRFDNDLEKESMNKVHGNVLRLSGRLFLSHFCLMFLFLFPLLVCLLMLLLIFSLFLIICLSSLYFPSSF